MSKKIVKFYARVISLRCGRTIRELDVTSKTEEERNLIKNRMKVDRRRELALIIKE